MVHSNFFARKEYKTSEIFLFCFCLFLVFTGITDISKYHLLQPTCAMLFDEKHGLLPKMSNEKDCPVLLPTETTGFLIEMEDTERLEASEVIGYI